MADRDDATIDSELRRLTDDVRRAEAVEARRREQWLRRQAEAEGTFHGMLVDLVERQVPLAVRTVAGRVISGRARTLGADFVALETVRADATLVPLLAVTSVSAEPGSTATVGDRAETTSRTLDVALSDLSADRPPVVLHTVGADRIAGRLWVVGRDVLVVRAEAGTESYAPLHAVNDIVFS